MGSRYEGAIANFYIYLLVTLITFKCKNCRYLHHYWTSQWDKNNFEYAQSVEIDKCRQLRLELNNKEVCYV